jgi:hypothetical protein
MGNHGEQKDAKTRYLPLPTVLRIEQFRPTDLGKTFVFGMCNVKTEGDSTARSAAAG